MTAVGLSAKITRNRFRELSRQGQQAAATWNAKRAESVARKARRLVPVDTGALKESIAVELNRRTGSASVTVGNAQVDYAPFVEYGTRHTAAQPFLTPAAESEKKEMRNRTVRLYKG